MSLIKNETGLLGKSRPGIAGKERGGVPYRTPEFLKATRRPFVNHAPENRIGAPIGPGPMMTLPSLSLTMSHCG